MILEKELEDKIISELSGITELSSCQFTGSRQIADNEDETISESDNVTSVIAVGTGYRVNDAFSLSPISVPVTIQICTRIEKDKTGEIHEKIIEAISDKLSFWHKFSNAFTTTFDLTKMFCGEIRINGGTGRSYSKDNRIWMENISFTIRGSERYNTSQT